jgi:hypothetical protein
VERSHKLFPIRTDYTGLTLATTLQEHIAVEANGEEISGAWLYKSKVVAGGCKRFLGADKSLKIKGSYAQG